MADNFELDEGHFHEVMDRASMMVNIWESEVRSLGATKADPRLKKSAKKAARALMDFYQLAGAVWSEHSDD